MEKHYCNTQRGIRIKGVSVEKFNEESERIGETRNKILRKQLTEISEQYPDDITGKACEPCGEITISGLSQKTTDKLKAVAYHLNVNLSDFIKVKLGDKLLNKKAG